MFYENEFCFDRVIDWVEKEEEKEEEESFDWEMEEPSKLKRAVIDSTAGAIAGGISRTVTSPLDVIKIRFQVLFCFGSICFCVIKCILEIQCWNLK